MRNAFNVGLLALALAAPSADAIAKEKDKKVKVKVKDDKVVVRDEKGRIIRFVDADRVTYRNWWRSTYGRNCPPGLVRVENYCVASGQTRRRYVIGEPLATTVVVTDVPAGLRLRAAPVGYRYAYVDGDVVLLNTATRVVADVIEDILD